MCIVHAMAKQIKMSVPSIPVQNSDIEFEVRENGALVGRLRISKGGIDWYRKNAKKLTGKASWTQLQEFLES